MTARPFSDVLWSALTARFLSRIADLPVRDRCAAVLRRRLWWRGRLV